jgi:uncharacterized protein (TIGR02145 family)
MEAVLVWNKNANTPASSRNVIANPVRVMQSIAILLLAACGDDSGNNVSSRNGDEELSNREVSSIYELGVCDETNALTSTFVSDKKAFYFCDGTEWQKTYSESPSNQTSQIDNFDNQQSSQLENTSSSKIIKSSSSVKSSGSVKSSSSVRSNSSAKSSASVVGQSVNSNTCGDLWCNGILIDDSYSTRFFDTYVGETEIGETIITLDNDNGKLKVDVSFGYPKEGGWSYAGVHFLYINGNISDWDGICLVYQSTRNFGIELDVKNEDVVTAYDNYKAVVEKTSTVVAVDFPWSSFRQEGWGEDVRQEIVLANTNYIRLKFEGEETSETYIIQSMGRLGTCKSGGSPKTSSSAKSSSSQKIESSSSIDLKPVYGTLTDSRDGQKYKTVEIGTQTWMAQNLNYKSENSYCYGNDSSNCNKYGRLYMWAAAVGKLGGEVWRSQVQSGNIQGACPNGWHLPTLTEWNTFFTAVGDTSTAGEKLKSTSGWINDGNGTDVFGFSALPAGSIDNNGKHNSIGSYAYFWSSTDYYDYYAYYVNLYSGKDYASLRTDIKSFAFSVRCLQD